ncbi:class I SAM-dependent methyltransferase [Neolewinella persica]|uniref:class I SAM-dependent methyltransferase n=1 Tax=Neolewinella persica TaxID=70998 RepID=UPI00036B12FC|nr:methyltransferase domain-containing protein [Neolewinella persica]
MRQPFQGVSNIVRFNWHFYLIAVVGVSLGLWFASWLGGWWFVAGLCLAFGAVATMVISLIVSWYIYDRSDLYRLTWLPDLQPGSQIVNIHAGFDETSGLLTKRYPEASLQVFDFYDPELHTEISIKRAREAYAPHPGTMAVSTTDMPLKDGSVDVIFLLLAAHEIRNAAERTQFFALLRQALKPGGRIIVTEHLRDPANFLAYTVGAFHFLAHEDWRRTFEGAALAVVEEKKLTPFLTTFTLVAYADPS